MTLDIDLSEGCPDCGCVMFHVGPRGGASINVMCAMCCACFNHSAIGAHRIESRPVYNTEFLRKIEELP